MDKLIKMLQVLENAGATREAGHVRRQIERLKMRQGETS